jgi:hypothetical protein
MEEIKRYIERAEAAALELQELQKQFPAAIKMHAKKIKVSEILSAANMDKSYFYRRIQNGELSPGDFFNLITQFKKQHEAHKNNTIPAGMDERAGQ